MLSKLSKLSQTFQSQAKDYLNPFHNSKLLKQFFNFYPPYFGAGIRVESLDFANHHIRVRLPLNKLNQNIVGTQFGGSLYSMTDPFLMILLMQALGNEYVYGISRRALILLKRAKAMCLPIFTWMTPKSIP